MTYNRGRRKHIDKKPSSLISHAPQRLLYSHSTQKDMCHAVSRVVADYTTFCSFHIGRTIFKDSQSKGGDATLLQLNCKLKRASFTFHLSPLPSK